MDGILEQILIELKEIKQLMAAERRNSNASDNHLQNDTMTVREAAKYLGIAEQRLRSLTAQGSIRHLKAGNRFLYKRKSLDIWLEEVQNESIKPDIKKTNGYRTFGRID